MRSKPRRWKPLPGLIVVFALTCSGMITTACTRHDARIARPADASTDQGWTPAAWTAFQNNGPTGKSLPDFSFAGYAMGRRPIPEAEGPLFDVTAARFGARPNDGIDDTAAIQAAIEAAGAGGGGVVFLPAGRYDIHSTPDRPFLRIRHDHVVLRGQGSTDEGTLLHLGSPGPAGAIKRLGTVPAEQESRHYAVVAILGNETRRALTAYSADAPRGTRVVSVADSAPLSAGQTVVVAFTDPLIDAAAPRPDKADLAAQLTAPFQFRAAQNDSFGAAAKTHAWIVPIADIVDRRTIRLAKPARFDQLRRYQPRVYSFEGVRGVGIEHLRMQSSWPGGYRHHKPFTGPDGTVVRAAKEQDYLWNGIWISFAVDCWVRDVVFKDLTQGVIVSRAADITIEKTAFQGLDGHAGITIAHSNDVLVRAADFQARMVHPVTLKNMAAGNVVSDCVTRYDGRDDHTATDANIDFHGLFPYENLFENLDGFYVCPGGDLSVMPHAGVRNVFWNIRAPRRMSCYTGETDTDFARTYDWGNTSSGTPATMFEHFPQAFYIGIVRKEGQAVTLGGSSADRRDAWMTVEGLNRPGLNPPSLYAAQRRLRLN